MAEVFTIVPLDNKWCEQIAGLILPIQQIEFNVPITLEGQPDLLDIETNYLAGGGGFWGAVVEGELVGTIALMATGHNAGVIRKMFVRKNYRGSQYGIAQRLLQKLIDECRVKGITDVYLGTFDALKAACRFYEKNGFVQLTKEELPHFFPYMKPDNVFYTLHLTA